MTLSHLSALMSSELKGRMSLSIVDAAARTIARRAERRFWTLAKVAHDVPRPIGVLLNRMSDLFFSWARRANVRAGVADVPWTRQKSN